MATAVLTLYTGLKTVHILAVIVWLGGGVMLAILGVRAMRAQEPLRLATIAGEIEAIASKLFPAMGILLVATGFWMVANGDLDFDAWVVIGLIGWAVTFATGVGVLSPTSARMNAAIEEHGPESAEAQARIRRLLVLARIDLFVVALVVVDMVIKPG
jgi:uncharacterized membrane protein